MRIDPIADRANEAELIVKAKAGDKKARDRIVAMHMGLVHLTARKFGKSRPDEIEDLVSEGVIGLLKAIEMFEPERGFKLITYADQWISHFVRRHVQMNGSILSGSKPKGYKAVGRRAELIEQGYDQEEATRIAAQENKTTPQTLTARLALFRQQPSFDAPFAEGEDRSLHEVLSDASVPADIQYERSELREYVNSVVDELRPQLSKLKIAILDRRLLVEDEDEETLKQIADTFGLSKERVRQVQVELWAFLCGAFRQQQDAKKKRPSGVAAPEPVAPSRAILPARVTTLRPPTPATVPGGALSLNAYQLRDYERIESALRCGQSVIYVLPTGAGKTRVAVKAIRRRLRDGSRGLVLVPRIELVEQMFDTLVADGLAADEIGILRGEDNRERPEARLQVASVQTVVSRKARPPADFVVVDECHHAAADGLSLVLDHYKEADTLGLTATPCRMDGKPLGAFFDQIILGPTHEQLFTYGWLVRPSVFSSPNGDPDLQKVRTIAGDFHRGQLEERLTRNVLVGDIVEHWTRLASGRPTVCYAAGLIHAGKILAAFLAANVRAELLTGETPNRDRRDMIGPGGRLEMGTTQVVITCDVLSEGWDMPAAKCAILARPTQSLVIYLQQIGRILRPHGTSIPLVLDHAGNVGRHDVPWLERPWSLDKVIRRDSKGKAPVRKCPGCNSIQPVNDRTCAECGHTVPPIVREPDAVDGALVDVARLSSEQRKKIEANVRAVAKEIGADEAWIAKTLPLALGAHV